MPSSAWAVTAAAGSAVATAKPRAKCFRRMAVSPLFAAGLHRRVFNWPSISSAEKEGSRPAAAGAGIAVECAPSIRKGPHLHGLFSVLFSFVFFLGATTRSQRCDNRFLLLFCQLVHGAFR